MKAFRLYATGVFIIVVILFGSCKNEDISCGLYEQRELLLEEFKDKSIISRGGKFYQLAYYKDELVNIFYFEKDGNDLVLINQSIQYNINEIDRFSSVGLKDSSIYRQALTVELKRLLKIMESLQICHVSADHKYAGVDMKIYSCDSGALLYIKNVTEIKNNRWKDYVSSGQKLDENWYCVEDKFEQ